MAEEKKKSSTGLEENIASLLCYLGGWITGLIFVLIEKDNKVVKFHAWQALITFIALNVISIIPVIGWIIGIATLVLWVILMIRAYQGKMLKLPIVGNFAEKQANK